MARSTASKPFLRQPTYASKIDPSHPIGKKVTAAIAAHYGASVRISEMISGQQGTVLAGAINGITAGIIGKTFRPNNTSSSQSWAFSTAFCDMQKPFSVEFLFTYLASDVQYSRVFDCGGGASPGTGGSGGWDFEIGADTSTLNVVTWVGNGNNAPAALITGLAVGRTYHIVWSGQGQSETSLVYINGGPPTTITSASGMPTAPAAVFNYSTYRSNGDLSAAGIALHLARFYQGTQVTGAEVKRLYERPFEMFRRQRRVFTNAIAGGDVMLALSGSAAAASPGSIAKTSLFTVPLMGSSATAVAGSVAYSAGSDLTLSLSGSAATAAAGTLGKGSLFAIGLSGAAAAAAAGNIAPARSVGITGSAGVVSPGLIAKTDFFTIPLGGNAATASPGNVGATGDKTIVITGTAMTATAGSIAVAGADFWHPIIPGAATWTPQTSAPGTWTPQ